MSHKGKNSAAGKGKKSGKGGADAKAEDVLQAVVSFNPRGSLSQDFMTPI